MSLHRLSCDVVVLAARHGEDDDDPGPYVLAQQREAPIGAGLWACPGGGLDEGERLVGCAVREVLEETGLVLDPDDLVMLGVYDDPERDGRLHEGRRTIAVGWTVRLPACLPVRVGPDERDLRWWPVHGPRPPLAFDHELMLADALARPTVRKVSEKDHGPPRRGV